MGGGGGGGGGREEKKKIKIFEGGGGGGRRGLGRRFAKAIVETRKKQRIFTTGDFLWAIGNIGRRGKTHPATQIFQALRIAVNGELDNLKIALEKSFSLLAPNGRMAII